CLILSFFFQAEDGIRDPLVTGVQTCALPIFTSATIRKSSLLRAFPAMNGLTDSSSTDGAVKTHSFEATFQRRFAKGFTVNASYKIGRASCRERVWIVCGAVSEIKKKAGRGEQ